MAESGLNPKAWRDTGYPDISGGLTQISIALAAAYGVGDGLDTWANKAVVRAALSDRTVALDLGARYLAECMTVAGGDWLGALKAYNAGAWGLTAEYEQKYPGNIKRYQDALAWAHEVVGAV